MWLLVYSTFGVVDSESNQCIGQTPFACNVSSINVALRSVDTFQRTPPREGLSYQLINAVFISPNTDPALLERADVIVVEPLLHDTQQQQQQQQQQQT